jgi:hypothetical protein
MNILGESFATYVNNQVNTRQKKYAEGLGSNRSTQDITFMNSKTSFARLMSSVEVNGASNYKNVNALGLAGLALAKKYVLFSGTTTSTPGFQRSGIGLDGAYGVGGFELGYRPMPGITSVEVKTDGNGFTNSATVKVKAYNRQQLETLDALYLRLGYYMLLEWGNVIYWNNDGTTLVNDPHDNSLQDYFFNPSNKKTNDVLLKIKEKREKSCGNYDALFGKVINFNWSYAADNTFDITINLRSIGDIIESLKINSSKTIENTITTEPAPPSEETPPPYEYYKNKNAIGALYYKVVKEIFVGGEEIFTESAGSSLSGEITFTKVPFKGENEGFKYYIKLSRLLSEIKSSCIYNLNGDKDNKVLDINFDSKNNFIPINEVTLSVDPNVCIVKRSDTIDLAPLLPGVVLPVSSATFDFYPSLDEFIYSGVPDVLFGKLMNIYINFDFLLEKLDAITDAKTNRAPLKEFLDEILIDISRALGSANDLGCFIDEESNKLTIIDRNPYPFRDELLKSIGVAPRETTRFNITGYFGASNQTNSTSFVKSLNFQTQIPPEFATIISIGAAANKKTVGEDTTAFSKLNKGLTTRFAESITDGNENLAAPTVDETPNAMINAILPLVSWVAAGNASQGKDLQWNLDTFASNKSILADLVQQINKIKSKEDEKSANSTSSPTSGFIPVNVSLTMDGLSGMKIFQKFDLDASYLPSNYPDAVEILIKGISHTIQNNIWDTTIESVIVGKSSAKSKTSPNPVTPITTTTTTSTTTDNKAQTRGNVSQGSPLPHTDDSKLSPIRNAILRIARGYVGQAEVPGFDNLKFNDPAFEAKMKSIGWRSSPGAHWCNWFTDLVWREAYTQVGATDPKIQNIFKTKLNSKVLPPLAAGVFNTLEAAVNRGFGKYVPGASQYSGGVKIQDSKNVALPKPGDMVIYSSGHVNICVSVDPVSRTFSTIGGNEGKNNNRNGAKVDLKPKYWSTQLIRGIVSVIES